MRVICPMRNDAQGAGHFGAPRGSRTHLGVDYACTPGAAVLAVEAGVVTRLGFPYGDDLSYRYVEITDADGKRARYFYVLPAVDEGDPVDAGEEIGFSQALGRRYEGITEHIHFEVKDHNGAICDPEEYLCSIRS